METDCGLLKRLVKPFFSAQRELEITFNIKYYARAVSVLVLLVVIMIHVSWELNPVLYRVIKSLFSEASQSK